MAVTSSIIFIFLIVPACTNYTTGTIGNHAEHNKLVLLDIGKCTVSVHHFSLIDYHRTQFICINEHLSRCLLRNLPAYLIVKTTSPTAYTFCAAFSIKGRNLFSFKLQLFIDVRKRHVTYMEVLKFNFDMHRRISCVDHGLMVFHERNTSEIYCGRRVPWTMLISSQQASLQLAITAYIAHELSVFYSSFKTSWVGLGRTIVVRAVYIPYDQVPLLVFGKSIISMQYYVMTNHHKYLLLHVTTSGSKNGHVIVHDGPGTLSKRLLMLSNTTASSNKLIMSSAYCAFVDFFLGDNNRSVTMIDIKIRSHFLKATCSHNYLFSETSSKFANTVCVEYFILSSSNMALFVKNFSFSGPTMLADISAYQCQYGGLSVTFDRDGREFEYCEDLTDFTIYSETSMLYVSLVWYTGYSRGSFLGNYQTVFCRRIYAERYPPHKVYQNDILTRVDTSYGCQVIICPPLQADTQIICTIQLGPASVGTTRIQVYVDDTLEPCDPRFVNVNSLKRLKYKLKAKFTDNWPFGLINNTDIHENMYDITPTSFHNYDFLQMANITLYIVCYNQSPRKQTSVSVKISSCTFGIYGYRDSKVHHTLSDLCLNSNLFINSLIVQANEYHFIYKGNDEITTGHLVSVSISETCPKQCGNMNYTVFVRSVDEKSIIELTRQVGHGVFTGYYHLGFRVSIVLPEATCSASDQYKCDFSLSIHKPRDTIGAYKYKEDTQIFRHLFRNKR